MRRDDALIIFETQQDAQAAADKAAEAMNRSSVRARFSYEPHRFRGVDTEDAILVAEA